MPHRRLEGPVLYGKPSRHALRFEGPDLYGKPSSDFGIAQAQWSPSFMANPTVAVKCRISGSGGPDLYGKSPGVGARVPHPRPLVPVLYGKTSCPDEALPFQAQWSPTFMANPKVAVKCRIAGGGEPDLYGKSPGVGRRATP